MHTHQSVVLVGCPEEENPNCPPQVRSFPSAKDNSGGGDCEVLASSAKQLGMNAQPQRKGSEGALELSRTLWGFPSTEAFPCPLISCL